jgi:hypothetical protein
VFACSCLPEKARRSSLEESAALPFGVLFRSMDVVTKTTKITEPSQVSDECPATASSEHFKDYEMYGWKPDPALPDDDNYMDMVVSNT